METMRYIKHDDWGNIYYTRIQESGLGFFSCRSVNLKAGRKYRITWKDGTNSSVVSPVSKPVICHISDMGHSYTVNTSEFGFETYVHGTKVWIPLEDVDVTPT